MAETRMDQAVRYRLDEMRDLFSSGLSELTGKIRREHTRGEGQHREYGDVVGRYAGVKAAFPELRHTRWTPGQIRAAIERGSGKIYRGVRELAREGLAGHVKEARAPERPSVGPHDALTSKCKRCGVPHGRGAHRFHGRGSWLQTHLFPFKRNPALTAQLISGRVTRIEAKKTGRHVCDAECKKFNHCYFHPFGSGVRLYRLSSGDLWLTKRDHYSAEVLSDRPGLIYGRVLAVFCVIDGRRVERQFPAGVKMYGLANKDLLITRRGAAG